MLIRLSWLFTRRLLLVVLLLDCTLFAAWFQLHFGNWPAFSMPLTWLLELWLLRSYVLGSFYDQEGRPSAMVLK